MNWIVKVLKEMRRTGSTYVQVKEEAEKSYREMIDENLKRFVWDLSNCQSWYTDDNGVNVANYPGNSFSFWNQRRNVDSSCLIFK